jgi:hypothetical protein
MQAVLEGHDTPVSEIPDAPGGAARLVALHVSPFQTSTTPFGRAYAVPACPTATHMVAVGQDTPVSFTNGVTAGAGIVWSDQVAPFQRSASSWLRPRGVLTVPTAVHALGLLHDTSVSAVS